MGRGGAARWGSGHESKKFFTCTCKVLSPHLIHCPSLCRSSFFSLIFPTLPPLTLALARVLDAIPISLLSRGLEKKRQDLVIRLIRFGEPGNVKQLFLLTLERL